MNSISPSHRLFLHEVDELTDMSEGNRLDLLKEVAGTRVYDEKKGESVKIMRDTS